jgi:hypothetical protein
MHLGQLLPEIAVQTDSGGRSREGADRLRRFENSQALPDSFMVPAHACGKYRAMVRSNAYTVLDTTGSRQGKTRLFQKIKLLESVFEVDTHVVR